MPPVPNFREPDPELGTLNLSRGGVYPVRYALRLAAGFGSQISMLLLRWTPVADGLHRSADELGYAYRIADPAAWPAWLRRVSGYEDPELEVVQHRLRVVDQGPSAAVTVAPERSAAPAALRSSHRRRCPSRGRRPRRRARAAAAAPSRRRLRCRRRPLAGAPVDGVEERVLAIVAEQTGYPPDMLDMDLDLEADLGIDTVKQAEVFATIREALRDRARRLAEAARLPDAQPRRRRSSATAPALPAAEAAPSPCRAGGAGAGAAAGPGCGVGAGCGGGAGGRCRGAGAGDRGGADGLSARTCSTWISISRPISGSTRSSRRRCSRRSARRYGIERDDSLKLRDYPTLNHVIGVRPRPRRALRRHGRARAAGRPPAPAPARRPSPAPAAVGAGCGGGAG